MRSRFTAQHHGGTGAPVVLLHGFMDTWRSWELVIPALERDHEVLAPTLVGHTGGPAVESYTSDGLLADGVERAMDDAGIETAHVVGNSLGGYVAMHLAERGRARSVTALAPAGGWPAGDASFTHACSVFERIQRELIVGAHLASLFSRTRWGRRHATRIIASNPEHISRELIVHMARGARRCTVAKAMLAMRHEFEWHVDPDRIECPVQIVWGTADRVLLHPVASSSYRAWFPQATWTELDGVGHCPQLDDPDEVVRIIRAQVAAVELALTPTP